MTVVITYRDRGFAAIRSSVDRLGALQLRVGLLGSAAQAPHPLRDDISLGEVGLINEYGSEAAGVPERPWLRPALTNRRQVATLFAWAVQDLIRGTPATAVLHNIGRVLVQQVKSTIQSGVEPENAPLTVRKKGHGLTLRHTFTLLESVTYEVARSLMGGAGDSPYDELEVAEGAE